MVLKFALALLVPFLLCSGALSVASDFDHFRLILVWPGSICNSQTCCLPYTGEPAEDFLVQDLQTWGSLLWIFPIRFTSCSKDDRFYVNLLRPILSRMILYWTTLECPTGSPQQMWNTTWLESGTCSGMDEAPFFSTGLNLTEKADLLANLRTYGIRPSDTKKYPLQSIRNALETGIGKKVVITCNSNYDGESQIYNVHLCANTNGTAFVDCPHRDRSCSSNVLFPPFPRDMLDSFKRLVDLKMVV